jgi:hypothetical protein
MLASRIAVILALILATCAAVYGLSEASLARGLLQDQIKLTQAAEERTRKIQSNLRAVRSDYATSELRLRAALATTPDRGTPRPVYDELCRRAKCAKLDSMPTPAD